MVSLGIKKKTSSTSIYVHTYIPRSQERGWEGVGRSKERKRRRRIRSIGWIGFKLNKNEEEAKSKSLIHTHTNELSKGKVIRRRGR